MRATRTVDAAYQDAAKRLGGKGGERVLRRGLRAAFSGFISDARSRTPSRTGRLLKRVDVRPAPRRDRRDDFFAVDLGYFKPRPYQKAVAVEFGNVNVTESAPLRTAFGANEGQMVRDASSSLAAQLDKVADELVRKLSQQRRR